MADTISEEMPEVTLTQKRPRQFNEAAASSALEFKKLRLLEEIIKSKITPVPTVFLWRHYLLMVD